MLIITLPPVHQKKLLREVISHPQVQAVRYNTGVDSAYSQRETLEKILELTVKYGKPFYVDLKGRQLRVVEWATLPFGPIVLNHRIKVDLPAKVFFRGDDSCDLREVVDGRKLYVDPLPKYPVGRGQAVNVIGKNLEIDRFFTDNDYAYTKAAIDLGVSRFMLSFVEDMDYIVALEELLQRYSDGNRSSEYEIVLKIESQAGVEFVRNASDGLLSDYQLMAARDDLMIQIGGLKMIEAIGVIIERDPDAICASRLLMGLEQAGEVTMADISDLQLMQRMGYKRFMLSDGVSRNNFKEAIKFWRKYVSLYM